MSSNAFLLKEHLGDNAYATIAGLTLEEDQRTLNSVRIVAKGLFTQSRALRSVQLAATYGTEALYELSFETGDRLRGKFAVERCDYAGVIAGEPQYRLTLKSVGAVKCLESI